MKEIFEGLEDVNLSRVHFSRLGDSALEFDVVYNLDRPAYGFYMDTQEQINLALKEKFEDWVRPSAVPYTMAFAVCEEGVSVKPVKTVAPPPPLRAPAPRRAYRPCCHHTGRPWI